MKKLQKHSGLIHFLTFVNVNIGLMSFIWNLRSVLDEGGE